MGSWQEYVDTEIVGSGNLRHGAVITVSDGTNCGQSSGFRVVQNEGAAIAALFTNPSKALTQGVTVAGVKYAAHKGEERSIYATKRDTGVVLVKTKTLILIGYHEKGQHPAAAAATMEKLARELIENNL